MISATDLIVEVASEIPELSGLQSTHLSSYGELLPHLLLGEFAAWAADLFHEALRVGYWGWFDDDLAHLRDWGFDLDSVARPVTVWQGKQDRFVPLVLRVVNPVWV